MPSTVREYMEALSRHDPDAIVYIEESYPCWATPGSITSGFITITRDGDPVGSFCQNEREALASAEKIFSASWTSKDPGAHPDKVLKAICL